MTVKEHYDNHLGNFYSWFAGDFETNKASFRQFCTENGIRPYSSKQAIDLGAGSGSQSFALAELGFKVMAIDFNNQLLTELESRNRNGIIDVVNEDLRLFGKYSALCPELIICCGDTLSHLESFAEVKKLLFDAARILIPGGKIVLSFRDYSSAPEDTARFIPVKSDSTRILTCFLEYFPGQVRVTDLLYELENDKWVPKVSSYFKTRITGEMIGNYLTDAGFEIDLDKTVKGLVTIIGRKNEYSKH
jgi:SAM-dependent methyltransferase